MEYWPADSRTDRSSSTESHKKSHITFQIPTLEHGTLGASTLVTKGAYTRWAFAVNSNHGSPTVSTLTCMDPVRIFPPVRPPVLAYTISAKQQAEHGASFLRTHFPDIDVTAELVREQLMQDSEVSQQLDIYRPYATNRLAIVPSFDSSSRRTVFLAFPTGPTNCQLNMSPLNVSKRSKLSFKPSTTPVHCFPTPVQHIVPLEHHSRQGQWDAFLAVKTVGGSYIFKTDTTERTIKESPSLRLQEILTIQSRDVGQREIADTKLRSPDRALFVNDCGAVYTCDIAVGKESIISLPATTETSWDSENMWRLSLQNNYDLLSSGKMLRRLDYRAAESRSERVFTLQGSTEIIVSLEDRLRDNIVRLTTTERLIWLDERFPKRALLACKHNRQNDRTLHGMTVWADSPYTLLTSGRNGLVTIYDVSGLNTNILHLNTYPYTLPFSIPQCDGAATGDAVFYHPSTEGSNQVSLFTLSKQGSIYRLDICARAVGNGMMSPSCDSMWDTVVGTTCGFDGTESNTNALSACEQAETNLFPIYDHISRLWSSEKLKEEEEQAELVHQMVDEVGSFWHIVDAPVEHVLTGYDVFFRFADEPIQGARADFLTGSLINSVRGFRAFSKGRLSLDTLARGAGWNADLTRLLQMHSPSLTNDLNLLLSALRSFDLATNHNCHPTSLRVETTARENLALDLVLSSRIYASRSFKLHDDDVLETMTGSMSLTETPPFEFGFLSPIRKPVGPVTREPAERESICLQGVTLLLKDWHIGSDPGAFSYQEDNAEGQGSIQADKLSPPSWLPPISEPIVLATKRSIPSTQIDGIQSVGTSQEVMVSTQILPGPFGGRVGKKKPKKRLDGF